MGFIKMISHGQQHFCPIKANIKFHMRRFQNESQSWEISQNLMVMYYLKQ